MAELWQRFGGLPTWMQAIGWVLFWPLLVGLLLSTSGHAGVAGNTAAVAGATLVGTIWLAAADSCGPSR